jgi:hypothetical protein
MALAFHDISRTEQEIALEIGAKPYGTPSFAVQRLTLPGLRLIYREWTISALLTTLQTGNPLIAFVRAGFLDYWDKDFAHAVVVAGAVENERFWVYDPAKEKSPLSVSWNGFLAAWVEFSYRAAAIVAEP